MAMILFVDPWIVSDRVSTGGHPTDLAGEHECCIRLIDSGWRSLAARPTLVAEVCRSLFAWCAET
jgi:hypothetical protein